MKVIVEGKEAVLKQDFSFDYISENRLFLGRDGYTMSIAFPMKDCLDNIAIFGHIDRSDVDKKRLNFECAIIDSNISLFGSLTIVKVTDSEVQGQFAEGRCAQTISDPFEETYITDLDLGGPSITNPASITPAQAWKSIDAGATEVALPWINENYPTAPNNWVKYQAESYSWADDVSVLSWQPYLLVIAKRICAAIEYSYDFAEWEQSPFRFLIVCNSLPGSWNMPEYAHVLPGWTVSEFFDKLELLLMCEFDFDHKAKSVKMRFIKNILDGIATVSIENPVDNYNADIVQRDNAKCDYLASKRIAYKSCSHEMSNYYSCDWYVKNCRNVKKYDTLSELIAKNKRRNFIRNGKIDRVAWGEQMGRSSTVNALLYAENVDTFYVFRSIGTEAIGTTGLGDKFIQLYVLQPVNVFGSGSIDDDETDTEEIEFVPVCIMDTHVSNDDDMGYMMYLAPASFDDTASSVTDDSNNDQGVHVVYDASDINQPGPASAISKGSLEKTAFYYDEIYVAFWNGHIVEQGKSPYPVTDGASIVTQDWQDLHQAGLSMRLHGNSVNFPEPLISQLPHINATQKFKFSWIDSKIPNTRAIFHIRGRRYVCEKITATFTAEGMSQLLKGEFYPLADEV